MRDERGASDVLGAVLLVGITVSLMTGVSFFVLSQPGPGERPLAQITTLLEPGPDGAWGTGSEAIVLRHDGGEPIPLDRATLNVFIDGEHHAFPGRTLQGEAPRRIGAFAIGETLRVGATLPAGSPVAVDFVLRTDRDHLLATASLLVPRTLLPGPAGAAPAGGIATYVDAYGAIVGTVSGFENAKQASPEAAQLREALALQITDRLPARSVVHAGGFATPEAALDPDAGYATATATGLFPQQVAPARFAVVDPLAERGPIAAVHLKAQVRSSTLLSEWRLQACLATCGLASAGLGTGLSDTLIVHDVTLLRPGGGTWSWQDVRDLEVSVHAAKTLSGAADLHLKHVWVEVESVGLGQQIDVELHWRDVPEAAQHHLELVYQAERDSFHLAVWDGTDWNVRGVLDGATTTEFALALAPDEYNGGSPRIRLFDAHPGALLSSGSLALQYARVVSTG